MSPEQFVAMFTKANRCDTSVDVTRIEFKYVDLDAPTLSSLRGIAPDATGDLSAAEFVRRSRDRDW